MNKCHAPKQATHAPPSKLTNTQPISTKRHIQGKDNGATAAFRQCDCATKAMRLRRRHHAITPQTHNDNGTKPTPSRLKRMNMTTHGTCAMGKNTAKNGCRQSKSPSGGKRFFGKVSLHYGSRQLTASPPLRPVSYRPSLSSAACRSAHGAHARSQRRQAWHRGCPCAQGHRLREDWCQR